MAIESVRASCQQMGVKEFFQNVFLRGRDIIRTRMTQMSHQSKQNLKKWF